MDTEYYRIIQNITGASTNEFHRSCLISSGKMIKIKSTKSGKVQY